MTLRTAIFVCAGVLALILAAAALIGRYSDRGPDPRLASVWAVVGIGFLAASAL
jgi:uncharacterized membrane protein YhiD involved in acid resistance